MSLSQVVIDIANFAGGLGTYVLIASFVHARRSRRDLARLDAMRASEAAALPPLEASAALPAPVPAASSSSSDLPVFDGNYSY